MSWHILIIEIYGEFLCLHCFVFALKYPDNCGILYTQVCACLNFGLSTEFATKGLQSSNRDLNYAVVHCVVLVYGIVFAIFVHVNSESCQYQCNKHFWPS